MNILNYGLRRIYEGPNANKLIEIKEPTEIVFKAHGVLGDIKVTINPANIKQDKGGLKVEIKNSIHNIDYDPQSSDGWIYFYREF